MSEVLFVCYRNALRSKIAAAYYNFETQSHVAESAGLAAGKSSLRSRRDVRQLMAQDGVPIWSWEDKRPRQLTEEIAASAGRIVLLTGRAFPEYVEAHPNLDYWYVPNPESRDHLDYVREAIKHKVLQDLALQAQELPPAS